MSERTLPDSHWLPPEDLSMYRTWERERVVLTHLVKLMNGFTHEMLPAEEYLRLRKRLIEMWEPYRQMSSRELELL